MKWERRVLLAAVVVLGIYYGIQNASLYGEVTLTDLVLRMSGSADKDYALETNYMDLLQFMKLMLPGWVFILCMGIAIYRHFCTAGIYIFVRCENRLRWYWKEIGKLCISAFAYQAIYMISVVAVSIVVIHVNPALEISTGASEALYCDAGVDGVHSEMLIEIDGAYLFFMHLLIWSLWMITMTVLVNIVAFYFQSNGALLAVISSQVICVTLLGTQKSWVDAAEEEIVAMSRNLGWNPVTRLVLGWQNSRISGIDQLLYPPYQGIYMEDSLAIYFVICGVALCVLAVAVKNRNVSMLLDTN